MDTRCANKRQRVPRECALAVDSAAVSCAFAALVTTEKRRQCYAIAWFWFQRSDFSTRREPTTPESLLSRSKSLKPEPAEKLDSLNLLTQRRQTRTREAVANVCSLEPLRILF